MYTKASHLFPSISISSFCLAKIDDGPRMMDPYPVRILFSLQGLHLTSKILLMSVVEFGYFRQPEQTLTRCGNVLVSWTNIAKVDNKL